MRPRDKLHMKAKSHPGNSILQSTYKRYRNFYNGLLKKVKINYDKINLEKAGKKSKKIWQQIRNITYTSKKCESFLDILQTDSTPLISANNANNFFVNVGINLAKKMKFHSQYLTSTFSTENGTLSSFVMVDIYENEFESTIVTLKDDCAVGWDDIPNKIVKQFRNILITPLTHIFRLRISIRHFPKCLKKAIVVPIYNFSTAINI
jgi:hypothetical protein